MTAILGIFTFSHDSAARIIIDGEIITEIQEERFTRKNMLPIILFFNNFKRNITYI